jgi:site-specific DNA-cytosine methylase
LRLPPPIRSDILKLGVCQNRERYAIVGIKLILEGERERYYPKNNTFGRCPFH